MMTYDEELYLMEEKYSNLPKRERREMFIKFLKDKLKTLTGMDLQLAHENLARFYLEKGIDIKEDIMNAHEAKQYFQKVITAEVSQSVRDASMYHLGHAALLEGNQRLALDWFEKALSSSVIDLGRKIKAYYYAARCAHQTRDIDKAREYLDVGRALDTNRNYQTEYEAVYYVIHTSQDELTSRPYLLSKHGESLRPLTRYEVDDLLEDSSDVILDFRSPIHPMLYFGDKDLKLTERFVCMMTKLSKNEIHSDDYWIMNVFETLSPLSLKGTVHRENKRYKENGIPIQIARNNKKQYIWEGPPLYMLTSIE